MRRSKSLGFVATAFCALMLGVGTGVATQAHDTHRHADGASQYGKVDNFTEQHADSSAKTRQENKNVPFSLFAVGSNNGKVGQFNKADTKSQAENSNKTFQDLHQDQNAEFEGRDHRDDCGCHDQGRGDGKGRGDSWGKGNESCGGQCGCDDNGRGDKGHGSDGASQHGTVDNWTKQHADSSAKTEQTNVNAPISIFSVGSNNDKVDQYNQADTRSKSENGNKTYQQADQRQDVSAKDGHGADGGKSAEQLGTVSNGTDQDATSYAQTKQINVNAPISVFSVGSNNGDVHQGNDANTDSSSSNWNGTGQSASQSQST
jgi:hypothetical protein